MAGTAAKLCAGCTSQGDSLGQVHPENVVRQGEFLPQQHGLWAGMHPVTPED